MARKVTLTCDECEADVEDYHFSRTLGQLVAPSGNRYLMAIIFEPWSDERAALEGMLHFENDRCAKSYLGSWLAKQREDAEKRAAEAKRVGRQTADLLSVPAVEPPVIDAEFPEVAAAPVQELDSVEKPAEIDGIPF